MSRRDRASRTSLLVRNLPMDVRVDDVRYKFERYGEIRDVYLPRDYYSNRPKGFGFVEYCDPRDAEEALYAMDGKNFGGRDIAVVMSKDSRKTPRDMSVRDEQTGRGAPRRSHRSRSRSRLRGRRRRSRSRSRSRRRSHHRSPHRRRERSYTRSPTPARRSRSRSPAPKDEDRRGPEVAEAADAPMRSPSPARSLSPQNGHHDADADAEQHSDESPRSARS